MKILELRFIVLREGSFFFFFFFFFFFQYGPILGKLFFSYGKLVINKFCVHNCVIESVYAPSASCSALFYKYRKFPVISPTAYKPPLVIGPSTWKQKYSSGYKPPRILAPPLVFLVFLILSTLAEPCTTSNTKLVKIAQ